jgi:dipeptidyl aminopeptidase/acylaminoacyl peptidase
MRWSVSSGAGPLLLGLCLFVLTTQAVFGGVSAAQPSRGAVDDVLVYERGGWVWTCDGEGKGQARLVQGARPGVSADGRLIACFRPSRGKTAEEMSDLWIYDREGGGETMIAPSFFAASSPVWSDDGTWIAFLARDAQARTRIVAVKADGSGMGEPLREGDGGVGFLCSLTFTPEDSLLTHDMAHAYWVNPAGGVLKSVPLEKIMGSSAGNVTSSDKFMVCPADPTVLVFSHAVAGTKRFEAVMHEPSSALSLHDSWVGNGKNMQITPREITAFDPVWSRDGKRVYFIGYRDTQAADADLFRILRVDRFGSGLKELAPGESVSVGSRSGGQ